jgi:hypothetical protein
MSVFAANGCDGNRQLTPLLDEQTNENHNFETRNADLEPLINK